MQRNFIELIEIVFVYKFPQLNFQEIGDMLGLGDLKQTRAYQEARKKERDEMLEKAVPKLLKRGLTIVEIAEVLECPVETVEQFVPRN